MGIFPLVARMFIVDQFTNITYLIFYVLIPSTEEYEKDTKKSSIYRWKGKEQHGLLKRKGARAFTEIVNWLSLKLTLYDICWTTLKYRTLPICEQIRMQQDGLAKLVPASSDLVLIEQFVKYVLPDLPKTNCTSMMKQHLRKWPWLY